MESQCRGLYHSAANGPQEVTLARYIPLSANRRLIIINHYPVYRLCVRTRMRLSLFLRYASPRRPVVCAHLTYPRKGGGEASARTFTYVLEISRSSAEALSLLLRHRDLPIAFRYGHFERQDRSYPTFSPSIRLLFASLAPPLRFFSTPPPPLRRSFSLINRWPYKYSRNQRIRRVIPSNDTLYDATSNYCTVGNHQFVVGSDRSI